MVWASEVCFKFSAKTFLQKLLFPHSMHLVTRKHDLHNTQKILKLSFDIIFKLHEVSPQKRPFEISSYVPANLSITNLIRLDFVVFLNYLHHIIIIQSFNCSY